MGAITAGLVGAGIAAAGTMGASAISSEMNNKAKSDRDKALAGNMINPVTGEQLQQAGQATDASLAQQQSFVNALQQQALTGTGPSVSTQLLHNQSDANNANAIAMAASQRGVNPGLALRNATQQNAIANQQAGQTAAAGRIQEQANAQGMASQGLNAMTQNNLSRQNQVMNAQAGYNNNLAGMANTAQQGANAQGLALQNDLSKGFAGAANGLGGAIAGGLTRGGGGGTNHPGDQDWANFAGAPSANMAQGGAVGGPQSRIGQHFAGMMMAQGGAVPAMVSPGERYLSPKAVEQVAEGKRAPMQAGEKIPGEAKVKGAKNSYANDTVPKTLEEGGIVLPRSVTQAKDAPDKARAFVEAIMAKKGLKK